MSQHLPPHLHLNSNVRGVKPSATIAINARSRHLQTQGRRIVRLGLGQSPFPVPEVVVEALRAHAHEKDYLPARGLPALREAVAGYLNRSQGLSLPADHVLIGPGSKELLFLLQLIHAGELVIPAPSWVSYAPQARILGRQPTWLATDHATGLGVTAQRLDAACRDHPDRARLLILNYPGNPTGTSYGEQQLREIAAVARRYRILVLADEIYGELDFAGTHCSIARFYPEGTIISGGLSKWCGAGGWRLGAFAFPPELSELADNMAAVASETFTSVSAPIQFAAVRAFQGGPEIDDYLARSRAVLGGLLRFAWQALLDAGARVCEPSGGFYLFPDFADHGEALARRGIRDGVTLTERLLEETGVACLPGADFGRPEHELSLRLALVDFDGAAALHALPATGPGGAYDVTHSFLERYCAPSVDGVRALCHWIRG
ncbi:MAG: aminotransferase class I/II-fold pyridoxal phosphate-dependent enzyme [Gammaproteobacteria bacterium]|jgi:aspartate aminotransferase|nr:aminotransferase class I/II-fold pyridoxal phosphate-dependent enzyme [Gammaproteobacteria bacterium]